MPRRLYPVLLAVALMCGVLVCGFLVIEPFLNLPPFWEQLDVGLALTGYGMLMLLGVVVVDRRLWPKKWRLSRKPIGRLQFMQRLVAPRVGH